MHPFDLAAARQRSLSDYAAELRGDSPPPAMPQTLSIVKRMRPAHEVCVDGVWIRAESVTALREAVEMIGLAREIAPGLWESE